MNKIKFKGSATGIVYDAILLEEFNKRGIDFCVVLIDDSRQIIRKSQVIG